MILCDLCGNQKECFKKEIDGREFDICTDCWRPLEEKLKGKGRQKRKRETVFLPSTDRAGTGGAENMAQRDRCCGGGPAEERPRHWHRLPLCQKLEFSAH